MTPKCTSWLGHKFEARYSKGPAVGHGQIKLSMADSEAVAELLNSYRATTYEGDVCVRCGCVVNRRQAT